MRGIQEYTNTDPESAEGRVTTNRHFITQRAPNIRRKLQSLRLGPKPHCQPWQRRPSRSITIGTAEEANKDGRLIKKTAPSCLHPPTRQAGRSRSPGIAWAESTPALPQRRNGALEKGTSWAPLLWESPQGHPAPVPHVNRSLLDALESHRHLLVGTGCQPVSGSFDPSSLLKRPQVIQDAARRRAERLADAGASCPHRLGQLAELSCSYTETGSWRGALGC